MAQIKIQIYPDGSTVAKTVNTRGPKCQNYARLLAELTDGMPVYIERTEEYFQNSSTLEHEIQEDNQVSLTHIP